MDESVFTVPLPVRVIPLLVPNVKVPVVFRVPPLKIILSASADPGVAPKLALEDIETVPADKVVEPVNVLEPVNTRVPAPAFVKLEEPAIIPS